MERGSALLFERVQIVQGCEKMKLEEFQNGGHNEQPNRLKCL